VLSIPRTRGQTERPAAWFPVARPAHIALTVMVDATGGASRAALVRPERTLRLGVRDRAVEHRVEPPELKQIA